MNLETLKKANELKNKIESINELIREISREDVCLTYYIGPQHDRYPCSDTDIARCIDDDEIVNKLCIDFIMEVKKHLKAKHNSVLNEFENL